MEYMLLNNEPGWCASYLQFEVGKLLQWLAIGCKLLWSNNGLRFNAIQCNSVQSESVSPQSRFCTDHASSAYEKCILMRVTRVLIWWRVFSYCSKSWLESSHEDISVDEGINQISTFFFLEWSRVIRWMFSALYKPKTTTSVAKMLTLKFYTFSWLTCDQAKF